MLWVLEIFPITTRTPTVHHSTSLKARNLFIINPLFLFTCAFHRLSACLSCDLLYLPKCLGIIIITHWQSWIKDLIASVFVFTWEPFHPSENPFDKSFSWRRDLIHTPSKMLGRMDGWRNIVWIKISSRDLLAFSDFFFHLRFVWQMFSYLRSLQPISRIEWELNMKQGRESQFQSRINNRPAH